MKIISFIPTAQSEVVRRILEHLGVDTVVPRSHGPPEWSAKDQQAERPDLSREEEDFSQVPHDWDEWEPPQMGKVIALPQVGELHHRDTCRAA